ncbi:uncharacterized protein EI90DRAFT_2906953 [Cantharellus anzutake]|uniref:uncharacterized protein n=1 Tax=Cantharellus anzutake TaxID=1750568 RepID=UPI0019087AB3|nr:uncharacterized protein EI90DRAFT_2906953 [Cantharellus anzutake]KAF8340469.1 hypothetical protein EI90DRAFT_2906953 [Cantharellus anzutake]
MVKKKAKSAISAQSKLASKEAKKVKAAAKAVRKDAKAQKKSRKDDDVSDDDEDLEAILEKMRIEWEEKHRVTEEISDGPPSRRANATLTPDPSGNYLWCIGGEYFSEDGKAHFYSDVYRYSPDKNEWRRFTSATCPGPRSAHAVVATPSEGGKLFLFGGEFSSLHQTTFHHYRDTWVFDIASKSWERLATKNKPPARSGHRMAVWKHFIVLFGGFFDPGVRTQYLNDLWIFDTEDYTWKPVEISGIDRKPSPRSGFSFLSTPEGIVLHGGYYQEYVKGKRPQGVVLDDTWFLRPGCSYIATIGNRMSTDTKEFKWERRKKANNAHAPIARSGCTMALWANSSAKSLGIMFGGVRDVDEGDEVLTSEFYNDMYGYNTPHPGKWVTLTLRKKKQKAGKGSKRKAKIQPMEVQAPGGDDDTDGEESESEDPDGGNTDSPGLPADNAMLAVLRNTLYIYGGILERGAREYTLDDFWSVALDKMDEFVCLRPLDVSMFDGNDGSSEEENDDEEDEGEGEESDEDANQDHSDPDEHSKDQEKEIDTAETVLVNTQLRDQAARFLEGSKTISAEEALRTPLPGETLTVFYARSREYWAQQAHTFSDNRGKQLRRDGFGLAQDRYEEYKPLLEEVEKILAEAGLDAEEMKRASEGTGIGWNHNRR